MTGTSRLAQLGDDGLLEVVDFGFGRLPLVLDLGGQRLIAGRIEVFERQLLELVLDLAHPEPVGDGRVDVERFLRRALLPVFGHVRQRTHVVKAIGELDEDDADVVDHREQHLAEVLGLPLLARRERDRADLGDPFDDVRHLGAEVLLDLFDGRQGVFDDVVQQPGGDGHGIEPHIGQNARHLERVDQVGLPRMPDLPLVLERREHVGPAKELAFLVRGVCSDPLEKVFESNHYLEAKSVENGV